MSTSRTSSAAETRGSAARDRPPTRASASAAAIRMRTQAIRLAIYTIGMVPAVWTYYLADSDQLGADPVKTLERMLGLWALRFLVVGLAITPLWRWGRVNLLDYRRAFGLLAFAYASFHLVVYAWLDQELQLGAIWSDIVKRPYITIGMAAFVILVPLAITSNDAMVKRLGAKAWLKLHRWVYLACAGAALHFLLLVKGWPGEPIIYAALVAGLLLVRLAPKPARRRPVTRTP